MGKVLYRVAEKFISINGEGPHAGELAVFIRFRGCSLRCSYCDTAWAQEEDGPCTQESLEELCAYVKESGIANVTLTGGEPLQREGMEELIESLCAMGCRVEIETNGSISLERFAALENRPVFTMDYKLPSSGMESAMDLNALAILGPHDSVKFVSGSEEDLERAAQIIERYGLTGRTHVFISPVFGRIDPEDIVSFMVSRRLNGVRLQLQMHKFIWDPDKRGV
ncbi:MAG: putative 7-carboxy-7-deazaguanine synthase QueE [Ruminococcus sp.]|nr:putative 7-carboxy-7-deazaguanine synthase QueE [Ruminococcus sp.]